MLHRPIGITLRRGIVSYELTMAQHPRWWRTLVSTLIILSCALFLQLSSNPSFNALAVDAEGASAGEVPPVDEENTKEEDLDWGTFYDPKEIFCGKYDCYKILGFDYTTFHTNTPDLKNITKSYRSLSLKFHPDKNKKKGAQERFEKIAKAYEILKNKKKRKEYDHYRDRPDEYFAKYGSSVMWSYAPQTDAGAIVFFLFILVSVLAYFIQRNRWQTIADHLIKGAVEDLSARDGGSTESQNIRRKALEILADQNADATVAAAKAEAEKTDGMSNRQKKIAARRSKQDPKKETLEDLKKIVTELVNKIDDFGAGFHKPTWKDLFVLKLLYLPIVVVKALSWRAKFYTRRLLGKSYSPEEIQIMTHISVGEIAWEAASDEEREKMVTLELWMSDNLEEWREDQKSKLLSIGDQKKYARMKKQEKKQGKQA